MHPSATPLPNPHPEPATGLLEGKNSPFTPGPWSSTRSLSDDEEVEFVIHGNESKCRYHTWIATVDTRQTDSDVAKANADLIARAPELLAQTIAQASQIAALKAALELVLTAYRGPGSETGLRRIVAFAAADHALSLL